MLGDTSDSATVAYGNLQPESSLPIESPIQPPRFRFPDQPNQAEWEATDPDGTWARINTRQTFDEPPSGQLVYPNPDWPHTPQGAVRCVCISDTHGLHQAVAVPPGDVLIHSG